MTFVWLSNTDNDAAYTNCGTYLVKANMGRMDVTQAPSDKLLGPIIATCGCDLRALLTELEKVRNALVKI